MAQCENESIFLSNDTENWEIFSQLSMTALSPAHSVGVANVNYAVTVNVTDELHC